MSRRTKSSKLDNSLERTDRRTFQLFLLGCPGEGDLTDLTVVFFLLEVAKLGALAKEKDAC